MRPITVTVGPLATAVTNNIVLSQNPAATSYYVLNGTLGTFSANSIALSQAVVGAAKVVINGALSQTIPQTGTTGAALLLPAHRIYITSSGNDTGITFAVVGLDANNTAVSETITGSNASVAVSSNVYKTIISITTSGSTTGNITVGDFAAAVLDTPRRVLITTASTTAFTISGTDWANDPISETVTNAASSVSSVLSYKTVTSILGTSPTAAVTVGTNQVADSPIVFLDGSAYPNVAIQCDVTGTVNYTLYCTVDDASGTQSAITPALVNWLTGMSPIIAAITSQQVAVVTPPRYWKVTLNTETAATSSVTTIFHQYGNANF